MIHVLLYRCFWIRSDWTKFHFELVKLMNVFKSNGYPETFINNLFKTFLDNKHRIKENMITVPKKPLFLDLWTLSVQTRTTLRKYLKGILNCCRLQNVLKSQNKLANAFHFKDRVTKELKSGVVCKFQCGPSWILVLLFVIL